MQSLFLFTLQTTQEWRDHFEKMAQRKGVKAPQIAVGSWLRSVQQHLQEALEALCSAERVGRNFETQERLAYVESAAADAAAQLMAQEKQAADARRSRQIG